ncbi:MAG: hypothetical protein LBR50_00665 [Tannerella sp.]|jgi:cytoplasmic iron level regulating protein YaaA (DUF328/UPF0246 family)|nr:hypothetical protein [Tannerella sp.]
MKNIALISCVSKKRKEKSKAKDLYLSALFTKSLKYAQDVLKPDNIFILSAKFGLLELDRVIEPYDETLNRMGKAAKEQWAAKVLEQLKSVSNLDDDKFIFLAGKNYCESLLPKLRKTEIPMKGMTIGKRLQWLNNKIGTL